MPVSGRTAMIIIYLPAFCFSAFHYLSLPVNEARQSLVALLLAVHFGKRMFEVLFIHKYSAQTDASVGFTIGTYYTLVCLLITHFQSVVPMSVLRTDMVLFGLITFGVGQLGNLYHHYLLSQLRKSDVKVSNSQGSQSIAQTAQYSVPRGGLFGFVTMPHYFFEIVAWLGLAICCQHIHALLVTCSMFTYLLNRAQTTRVWYLANVPGFPAERKSLVPFLL